MLTDSVIWNDFRNGKGYALSYIFFHHAENLFQYGRKFTKDEALIKDTIQEIFFHLITNRSSLGETDQISYYLMASFRHRITRTLKKERHHEKLNEEGSESELTISFSYEDEFILNEDAHKRTQVIRNVLATITPKQREILYYRFTCDYSYEKICDLMSIKYDSARKMVHRTLKTLREQLDHSDLILFYFIQKKFKIAVHKN